MTRIQIQIRQMTAKIQMVHSRMSQKLPLKSMRTPFEVVIHVCNHAVTGGV